MGSGPGQSTAKAVGRDQKGQVGILSRPLATKTRAKSSTRATKSKSGRRLPPKVKTGPDIPLLPMVVGGLLVAVAIVLIVVSVMNNRPTPAQKSVDNIPCDQLEHTDVHYHAALQIIYNGIPVTPFPGNVGRLSTCFYWLHTHAESPGVIHIESPKDRTFTLGNFFDIWATSLGTPEPLDRTHVSTFTLTPDQKMVIYVDAGDGKGPQLYDGEPRAIVLKTHAVITIEITPPEVTPPPKFTFESGL